MTSTDPAGGHGNDDGPGEPDGAPPIPPGPFKESQPSASARSDRSGPVPVFGAPENPQASSARPGPDPFAAPRFPSGQDHSRVAPWGTAGQAPNPYGQQSPDAGPYPYGPPPRKGGMPTWGWVLIGAGVLVLGAIGILFTLFVIGLASGVGSAAESSEPVVPAPDYTVGTDPVDPGAAGGIDLPELQPLGVPASFITPPSWSLPPEPWVLDESPAEGTFFFSNPNSCDMILEQAYMPPALEGYDDFSSDAVATQSYLTYLLEYFAELEGGTTAGTPGSVPVSINFVGGPTMDLATSTLPGMTLDGGPGVRHIATRAMPLSSGVVSAIITCPQTVLDADPAYFQEAVAELFILPSP